MSKYFAIVCLCLFFISCDRSQNHDLDTQNSRKIILPDSTSVEIAEVQQGVFNFEILSNGNSFAVNNAEIRFPSNKKIEQILVSNGDHVEKGQLLAVLDNYDPLSKLIRSKQILEKATVDLDDRLIDYGYRLKDSIKIPMDIMRMAKIKSSYSAAKYDYADAAKTLEETRIKAPFTGKIANLEGKPFNSTDVFKRLCTLIGDSKMSIEFNILETENRFLEKNSSIKVMPYEGGQYLKGSVTQINPFIDDNGMIKITALVDNAHGILIHGMSVKIIAEKPIKNAIYILKDGIVQRDGKDVVFTYENGLAKWNYVETGPQNTWFICIKSGLQKGQKVIVSNNINLVDDSKVNLKIANDLHD